MVKHADAHKRVTYSENISKCRGTCTIVHVHLYMQSLSLSGDYHPQEKVSCGDDLVDGVVVYCICCICWSILSLNWFTVLAETTFSGRSFQRLTFLQKKLCALMFVRVEGFLIAFE